MNLYLLTQRQNNEYDTYDACVVAASTEDEAKNIIPGGGEWATVEAGDYLYGTWATAPDKVTAKLIGKATKGTPAGVILASFNAG